MPEDIAHPEETAFDKARALTKTHDAQMRRQADLRHLGSLASRVTEIRAAIKGWEEAVGALEKAAAELVAGHARPISHLLELVEELERELASLLRPASQNVGVAFQNTAGSWVEGGPNFSPNLSAGM